MQKVEFSLKRSHGERCTPSSHPARRNRISGTRCLLVASSADTGPSHLACRSTPAATSCAPLPRSLWEPRVPQCMPKSFQDAGRPMGSCPCRLCDSSQPCPCSCHQPHRPRQHLRQTRRAHTTGHLHLLVTLADRLIAHASTWLTLHLLPVFIQTMPPS